MNYNASVSDFFKSPKWGMNALLGAVAMIIPVIGPLVLGGWHITGFWARGDRNDAEGFPDMDFNFFTKYLERGLWPFLVNLVASLVLVPVMMILMIPLFILMAASGGGDVAEFLFGALVFGLVCLQLVLMVAYQLIATPLMLRATLTQDFGKSFDLGFVRDFLSRMWKEMLVTMLYMFGLGLCTLLIGIATCYLGFFIVGPLVIFSWHHLQKQLYQIYLTRGGVAIPLSPKLHDLPPTVPPHPQTPDGTL